MSVPSFSPYSIAAMTYDEIASAIKKNSTLILPIGSLEPCTDCGALGTASLSCFALASKLSETMNILLAPMAAYGYSIAFKAFPGCGALSKRTLRAFLQDIMQSWIFQGIRTFIIVDGCTDNARIVEEAVKRPLVRHPQVRCSVLNWQRIPEIRSFIAEQCNDAEYDRSEIGILSMAAFLNASYVRQPRLQKRNAVLVDRSHFQRWRKTGADPEKFRKLFPDARTSTVALAYSTAFGETLFHRILETFIKNIKRDLQL
jgi:creatinine amidohydrolase/Fe(II)-dependent formamide hydrolase-like protein